MAAVAAGNLECRIILTFLQFTSRESRSLVTKLENIEKYADRLRPYHQDKPMPTAQLIRYTRKDQNKYLVLNLNYIAQWLYELS